MQPKACPPDTWVGFLCWKNILTDTVTSKCRSHRALIVSGEHCVWVEVSLAAHGGHVTSFVQEVHSDIPERRGLGVRSIF